MAFEHTSRIPDLHKAHITGGFFGEIVRRVREEMLPFQWKALNDEAGGAKSHCIENFQIAAGRSQDQFYGYVFQDSDVAKWLEAVSYQLAAAPDAELEALADSVIELIGAAQKPDGYLDTYYICTGLEKRWTNLRENHELYCAGHMLEAAVAYAQATGKTSLLSIMQRYVAHIDSVMGPEEGKLRGYPGHEEIELALCRLYEQTGDESALRLARYFLDTRGTQPNYFVEENERRGGEYDLQGIFGLRYTQNHLPVREQTTIEGHSVRALYLASGMAHAALLSKDESLLKACRALFDNVAKKRMYITGGVGSTHLGEAFTFDYDLPNDTVYAETCASIALIFFCRNMLRIENDAKYADVMEQALYNTCLAGMSLDQKTFFYVNPLSVWPEASHKDFNKQHVLPVRPKWFGCACCPPNLARLLSSLPQYAYTVSDDAVHVHLYAGSEIETVLNGETVHLTIDTEYPVTPAVTITAGKGCYTLRLRKPGWCRVYTLTVNGQPYEAPVENGYLVIKKAFDGDEIRFVPEMPLRRVYANAHVRADAGRVALMRGPVVYCLEERDNGDALHLIRLPRTASLTERYNAELLEGTYVIEAEGLRETGVTDDLYGDEPPQTVPAKLTFIPYYKWANRGENEMDIWVRE